MLRENGSESIQRGGFFRKGGPHGKKKIGKPQFYLDTVKVGRNGNGSARKKAGGKDARYVGTPARCISL